MRKRLWQFHSWLGLIAGLGLLVIGVTGSFLVFRDELDALIAPNVMKVEPKPGGRLPWDELYAAAIRAWPEHQVTGFGPRRDPHLAELVYLKEKGGHEFQAGSINPYTGEALSSPVNPSETFTGILLELHYTWFANHVGMLITGVLAALLCILGITGVWLYRGFWKSFFTLRWKKSARIFFSDLHKMVGISSVGFNLILGFTGAYWNLTHVASEGLSDHEETAAGQGSIPTLGSTVSLDALTLTAKEHVPGFDTRWISFPDTPSGELTLWGTVTPGALFNGDYGSSVIFDPQNGAYQSSTDLRRVGLWERITDTFAPLHYGTFGGLPIKILWCILGFAPGVLAVSGFIIWQRRVWPGRASRCQER